MSGIQGLGVGSVLAADTHSPLDGCFTVPPFSVISTILMNHQVWIRNVEGGKVTFRLVKVTGIFMPGANTVVSWGLGPQNCATFPTRGDGVDTQRLPFRVAQLEMLAAFLEQNPDCITSRR